MARLVGVLLALMIGLVVFGYVLAHFGIIVGLVAAIVLVGRYLHRHGA